jgi:ADP-heptose:LPS heptosyltransferase
MNLKIRDNLLKYGMHALNEMGMLHIRKLSEIDVGRSSGVLVVVTTALGDAVFCTPLFKALKQAMPDKKVGFLVHHSFQTLFLSDENVDVVIPYYGKFKRIFRTWRRLKDESFDIALAANMNDPDVIPLLYWAGIRAIIRRPWKSTIYPYLISNPEMMGRGQPPDHAIPMNLMMADMIGVRHGDMRTYLRVKEQSREKVRKLFSSLGIEKSGSLVCFHPGASLRSKMWPAESYSELGRRLKVDIPGMRIILTGTKKEASACSEITDGIGDCVVNLAGKLSISDLVAAIQYTDLFVSGDTGPFHIANALGIKTVTIYGPSDEKTNGPIWDLALHRVIKNSLDCYYDNCGRWCKKPACIEAIPVDAVYEECRQLLEMEGN